MVINQTKKSVFMKKFIVLLFLAAGMSFLAAGEKSFAGLKKECRLLASKSMVGELEKKVRSAVDSGRFTEPQCRDLMNIYGKAMFWGPRWRKGLEFLYAASRLEASVRSNEYFATYSLIAKILASRDGDPGAAIVILEDVLRNKSLHPANGYSACMDTASAYERCGDPEKALDYYRRALEYGKKVKFKFNCAPAEKAVERLSK